MTAVQILTRNSADVLLVTQLEGGLWRARTPDGRVSAHGETPESAMAKAERILDHSAQNAA